MQTSEQCAVATRLGHKLNIQRIVAWKVHHSLRPRGCVKKMVFTCAASMSWLSSAEVVAGSTKKMCGPPHLAIPTRRRRHPPPLRRQSHRRLPQRSRLRRRPPHPPRSRHGHGSTLRSSMSFAKMVSSAALGIPTLQTTHLSSLTVACGRLRSSTPKTWLTRIIFRTPRWMDARLGSGLRSRGSPRMERTSRLEGAPLRESLISGRAQMDIATT